MWDIWRTRNDQVSRHSCASLQNLQWHKNEGDKQHAVFIQRRCTNIQPYLSNGPPPGFVSAKIGPLSQAIPRVTIRIDGAWDKKTYLAGAAWVATFTQTSYSPSQGHGLYASSVLQVEATACLLALSWA
ncbi:hypothetical protein BVRB_6g132860 [Beta vulgaris subsp. vulgaris]|nr:hypothetical protein BVRB_6g132860 [Beta vulgaris subsp. vulgaris]